MGGYAGKAPTLSVPMSCDVEGATREEEFAACDQDIFGMYQTEGTTEPSRSNQGPGQIDKLWILDVDGSIVILDAMHGPAVPAELVAEMRAMVESATFEWHRPVTVKVDARAARRAARVPPSLRMRTS